MYTQYDADLELYYVADDYGNDLDLGYYHTRRGADYALEQYKLTKQRSYYDVSTIAQQLVIHAERLIDEIITLLDIDDYYNEHIVNVESDTYYFDDDSSIAIDYNTDQYIVR